MSYIHAPGSDAHDGDGICIGTIVDDKGGIVAHGQKADGLSCEGLEGTATNIMASGAALSIAKNVIEFTVNVQLLYMSMRKCTCISQHTCTYGANT